MLPRCGHEFEAPLDSLLECLDVLSGFLPADFKVAGYPVGRAEAARLREQRVREAFAAGVTTSTIALREGISVRSVQRYVADLRGEEAA